MTMAPLSATGGQADEGTVRRCFATLRTLSQQHGLARLSMGMSEDFLHAVAEGGAASTDETFDHMWERYTGQNLNPPQKPNRFRRAWNELMS